MDILPFLVHIKGHVPDSRIINISSHKGNRRLISRSPVIQ